MLQQSTHWRRTKSMFFDLRRSPTAFAEKVSVVMVAILLEMLVQVVPIGRAFRVRCSLQMMLELSKRAFCAISLAAESVSSPLFRLSPRTFCQSQCCGAVPLSVLPWLGSRRDNMFLDTNGHLQTTSQSNQSILRVTKRILLVGQSSRTCLSTDL